jgi:hypothetical protein
MTLDNEVFTWSSFSTKKILKLFTLVDSFSILLEMFFMELSRSLLSASIRVNRMRILSLIKSMKVSNNCLNSEKKLETKANTIKSTNSRATHAKAHLKNCIAMVIK